jgi:hypothetical protein
MYQPGALLHTDLVTHYLSTPCIIGGMEPGLVSSRRLELGVFEGGPSGHVHSGMDGPKSMGWQIIVELDGGGSEVGDWC